MAAIMDGFDPLAMPYMHSPMPFSGGNLQNLDYMSVPSVMDLQDQYSNFDSEAYMSGDELSFVPSAGMQHPALLKRYSSGFEDPFAESTMAQFDQAPNEGVAESPSIDRDSKYLSFSMPQYNFTLLDDSFRRSSVNINAQLHGMFFLAESQWPATPDTPPPPPELTCYRRNLFQITGSVTLPRNLRYVFTDDGSRIPIYELELSVSATESVEGNPVKIISVPWKTPANGEAAKPEDKLEKEPATIPLDKMSGQDLDTDFTTFPIQWKRLQFRIATANNGRRKELQQHFTLHLKIMASLSTGGKISIAEAHSGAVIVRGRSPRNFAARKDLPLSSSSTARKHLPSTSRPSNSQTSVPQVTSAPKVKTPPEDVPPVTVSYNNLDFKPGDMDDSWMSLRSEGMVAETLLAPSYSASMNPPLVPTFSHDSTPDLGTPGTFPFTFPQEMAPASTGAMSLHFGSDDEGSPYPQQQNSRHSSRPPTSNPSPSLVNKGQTGPYTTTPPPGQMPPLQSAQRPRLHAHQVSVTSVPSSTGPMASLPAGMPQPQAQRPELTATKSGLPFQADGESADQLYEYFPLGLDDWMPPVDAVFRPHVVHHSGPLPPDPRSPSGRHTSKRYFSEVA
jgi:acid phosphatase